MLAGLDGPPGEGAVRQVAGVVAGRLGVPVHFVHVAPGPGLRGEARRSALAQVARGETEEVVGRPETVLSALAQAPGALMTVLGARQRQRRPGGRRAAGTAMAVARRVSCPLLLVPPSLGQWSGPSRVLSALDGTSRTAMAAASALAGLTGPQTVATSLHIADGPGRDDGWNGVGEHGEPGRRERLQTRPIGRHVLQQAAETQSDLVVLVWSRQTRGAYGAAVLDVLGAARVPVLLVPVLSPVAAA